MTTAATRNLWCAAYWLANGLEFVCAERLPGSPHRVRFVFRDPHGRAAALSRQFGHDRFAQAFLMARRQLGAACDAAQHIRSRYTESAR